MSKSPLPLLFPPRPPRPPLFLAVYFCFVFENLYSTSPHFPLQFIQPSCIHIDLLLRVYDNHPTVAHVRTDLGSVDTSVAAIFHSAQKQLSISHIIAGWGIYQTQSKGYRKQTSGTPPTPSLPGFSVFHWKGHLIHLRMYGNSFIESNKASSAPATWPRRQMRLVRSVKKHRRHSETSLMAKKHR
jgi:hypothetical protein